MYIFPIIAAFAVANGQSQSSCLVQARFENAKSDSTRDSPFSTRQQQCIADYVQDVRSQLPDYDLSDRRFGGLSAATAPATVPILGAGFGTTATRSVAALARQLGLKVHHYYPRNLENNVLLELDELLIQNCSAARRTLNELNFLDILLSPSKLSGKPMDMLLDTPMGELFLDFYAASPDSKVVLTLREPGPWAENRRREHGSSSMPLQSPCGGRVDSLDVEVLAKLMEHHNTLVRCMVPPEKLLEINVFDNPDTTKIARFFGRERKYRVPMPHVYYPSTYSTKSERDDNASEPDSAFHTGDRVSICITGQIRRLELQSKIDRLIKPALAEGHRVEVYLVLDPRDETSYVHRAAGTDVGNYTIAKGSFYDLNETVKLFPSKVSVIFDPFIPEDHPIDPRYAINLMQSNTAEEALREGGALRLAKVRAKSHVRQWEALSRCWHLFHVINERPPKMALRVREDLAFVQPFLPSFEGLAKGIHVANCENFHGLNDKMAMLSGKGPAKAYFLGPLDFMLNNFSAILSLQHARTYKPMNPESVLFNVMKLSNVSQHFAEIPAYKATLLEDAEKQQHLCYVKGGAWPENCFWKLGPSFRKHTKAVFASKEDKDKDQAAYFCEP